MCILFIWLTPFQDKTVRLWNVEDSDNIPVVLENKKSIGLKVLKVSIYYYFTNYLKGCCGYCFD